MIANKGMVEIMIIVGRQDLENISKEKLTRFPFFF